MQMKKLPEIKTKPLEAAKRFRFKQQMLDFTIEDFWKWNQSDLVENRNRGILAEYIVKQALQIDSITRLEWDSFDFITEESLKIEVKSSAYIQSWNQKKKSSIRFDIEPKSHIQEDNTYSTEKLRNSDLYIFCFLHHEEQCTINPTDLSQWTFFLVTTNELNQKLPYQKSISISTIEMLKHEKCDFFSLKEKYDLLKNTLHNIQNR